MATAARRESIPLTEDDLAVLERLLQSSSLERRALEQLSEEVGDSKAALLHALLVVGIDAVRERAREAPFAEAQARQGDADAALISATQKVEHYEMAGYGSVREYAKLLGQNEIASLLNETLEEEKTADQKLNGIAKKIHSQAAKLSKAA